MIKEFKEFTTEAILKVGDTELIKSTDSSKVIGLYTFIRTTVQSLVIEIDGILTTVPENHVLVLTPNHHIRFIQGEELVIYQFNREFYCIKDHDKEVSCMGVLFYSHISNPILTLDDKEEKKLRALQEIFLDELETVDTIQAEMLRMLMARFIITVTRLIKKQSDFDKTAEDQVDMIRQFNILVDQYFRTEHSVTFYADKLFKSPKTLSNSFHKFKKSPLQIIHERIILEAKRLLVYTDKTAKEIAYEIGFEDASHLSRMFKKHTSLSPTAFKKSLEIDQIGKN